MYGQQYQSNLVLSYFSPCHRVRKAVIDSSDDDGADRGVDEGAISDNESEFSADDDASDSEESVVSDSDGDEELAKPAPKRQKQV